jgi:hypothetical protein
MPRRSQVEASLVDVVARQAVVEDARSSSGRAWQRRGCRRSRRVPSLWPARDFALARYNPGGSFDLSFSGDGKLTTDFGASEDRAGGVVLQGDDKIVVAGFAGSNFALARYLGG